MPYNIIDAWILNSIAFSEKENIGAELSDVIAYGDYSNHSIMTLSELRKTIEKLQADKLITILDNDNFLVAKSYKTWLAKKLENKKRFSIFKIVEDTEKFLKSFHPDEANANSIKTLPETNYITALEKYIKKKPTPF